MAAQENHESVVRYLLAHNANQALATEVSLFFLFSLPRISGTGSLRVSRCNCIRFNDITHFNGQVLSFLS